MILKLVRDSLPAYLLVLDSLAASPEATGDVLGASARLYAAYAVVFVADPDRSAKLAAPTACVPCALMAEGMAVDRQAALSRTSVAAGQGRFR